MEHPLSYILNDLGEERELYFNAMSPPVIQTSNYAFPSVKDFQAKIMDELNNLLQFTRPR